MKGLEKKILKTVIKNLEDVSNVDWKYGNLDDWSNWAKKMRDGIKTNVLVLETLVSEEDESQNDN